MRRALYTAICGGYNELKPAPVMDNVECIAFMSGVDRCRFMGWDVRPAWDSGRGPRMAAKLYKLLPHLVLPEFDASVWIDGTVSLTEPGFVDMALDMAESSGIGLWRHPDRDDIFTEAVVSSGMGKYRTEPVLEQAAAYGLRGHPQDGGLWACGILARWHTPEMDQLDHAWLSEVERWSIQDQLSFAYVVRQMGIMPGELPEGLYANPWLTVTGHNPDH